MNMFKGKLNSNSSEIIYKIKFLCVLSVVFMHSSVSHLVQPEHVTTIDNIRSFFGNYATINILFILSGYFFFYQINEFNKKIYYKKLTKRIYTLLVPYAIFCVFGFIFNYLIGDFEYSSIFRLLLKIFWGDPIIEGHPTGRALWFIRNLIVFALMSPLYYIFIKVFRHFTLLFVFICAIPFIGPQYDYPFFNVYLLFGAYLGLYGISFEKLFQKIGFIIPSLLVILILVTDLYFHCFIHPGLIVTCIFFFFLYGLVSKMNIKQELVAGTTFIYITHMYITSILRNVLIAILPKILICEILAFILTWALTIFICIKGNKFIKAKIPKLYRIIVGGRT